MKECRVRKCNFTGFWEKVDTIYIYKTEDWKDTLLMRRKEVLLENCSKVGSTGSRCLLGKLVGRLYGSA